MFNMSKKIIIIFILLGVIVALVFSWKVFGPGTAFTAKTESIYIYSDSSTPGAVMQQTQRKKIFSSPGVFEFIANRAGYWEKIQPGKYVIPKGTSTFKILKMLINGRQTPVKLVINKYRTREDIAGYFGRQMELDSAEVLHFFNSPDSVRKFGFDTNNIVTMVIPNTYSVYWTTPTYKLLRRLEDEHNKFWSPERTAKLEKLGMTKEQAYTLASIIEEETNKNDEKPIMASVYLNRIKKNMSLSADPTVKFALRNFALKRITIPHIREAAASPYNTYTNKGLPPGPICTPSIKTIDAILNAAETDYLFFCARADFSGYHSFASNEQDHFRNARAYQKALDSSLIK